MRIFIDTNILVSSALWPGSVPLRAFEKASLPPNIVISCEYNIHEMIDVFHRKFPDRLSTLYSFLSEAMVNLWIAPLPDDYNVSERFIRDINDRPILRAALNARADILLTGDKDFLDSGIPHPRIMNASEFLELD